MFEAFLLLLIGFGLGYGVRDWMSRRRRAAARAARNRHKITASPQQHNG